MLGVTPHTLKVWEREGILLPTCRTQGGHRRYRTNEIQTFIRKHTPREKNRPDRAGVYARVSHRKQRQDLARQIAKLQAHCRAQGYEVVKVYQDIGSSLNDWRSGLLELLDDVIEGQLDRVVCTYSDRLARFGQSLFQRVFVAHGVIWETMAPEARPSDHIELVPHHKLGANEEVLGQYMGLTHEIMSLLTPFLGKYYSLRRETSTLASSIEEPRVVGNDTKRQPP